MSGLEVIAAIASIVTLVDFSQKLLDRAAALRVSGKDVGDAFQSIKDLLPPISRAVQRTKERIESKEIDEETCTALVPIHRGVERTLEELRTVLQRYAPGEGASKAEVFWKAGKSIFQEKKVKGILQRLHEYVGVLTLSHAEAASAGTFSSTEKNNIQQILANIAHSNTAQAASLPRKCRNLLSLDGGGLRGLSILYILQDLMAKVNEHQAPPLKPCEVFDLIGGSGTGGLIAIMLGRLGMTVDECLDKYLDLFERLSSEQDETTKAESNSSQMIKSGILRATVSELIKARGLLPDSKLRNDENISCYTFVCAIAKSTNTIVYFQNYVLPGELDRRPVTIVDAACATLSSAKVFEAVQFGKPPSTYVAGDLGANNPIDHVWNEAQHIWSKNGGLERLVSCVVSVGAGSPRSRAIGTDDPGFSHAMYDIAIQTEGTAKKFLLGHPDLGGGDKRYHRFNVYNLPEHGWEGYKESGEIVNYAIDYMEGQRVEVEQCAKHLQRDIALASNDDKAPWIIPFQRNNHFTGRESQLALLEDKLFMDDRTTKIAIMGLGGMGKTQLALELVYRIREKYENCSIIWIPAINIESLQQAYRDAAKQLGIPGWDEDKADIKRLVQGYLSNESAGQWLLVFDNADDIDMWIKNPLSEREPVLIDYLPRSKHGCIVFTTRDRKTAVKLAYQNIVEVPEMDEIVAAQLLQKRLVNPDLVNNQPDTKDLLKELTYLPLAIVQAAAYINENGIILADYLSLLAEQEEDILDLLSEDFEEDGRYDNIKNPVATTWLISFEQIRYRDPLAADYLSFMACIDAKGIPQSLLPAGASRKKEIDAIGTLDAYSFITRRSADLSFDLHRLVYLATRNWLRSKELITQWTERAISRLVELLPDPDSEALPDPDHPKRSVWSPYLPHVHCVLMSNIVEKERRDRIELEWRFGNCLYDDGRYKESGVWYLEVMEMRMKEFGQEHPSTLTSMGNLALTYLYEGRFKKAEDIQVPLLELHKKVFGPEDPHTLLAMNNLAQNYREQGRWKEAEDIQISLLELTKKVLGAEHLLTLGIMNNLAQNYTQQGRWKEAEDIQVLLLELNKKVLGAEHPNTLLNMNNLARNYAQQGRWKEAEDIQVSLLELNKKVLGAEHPNTLLNMNNLALNYVDQGRLKKAEDIQVLLLELNKKVLGAKHPNTLLYMNNLAGNYAHQGRLKEAEDIQVSLLELNKKVLGAEHPNTLLNMTNLAWNYEEQGRLKEAEDIQVSVLELNKKVLGAEHPNTLLNMTNLAWNYEEQGRFKEAEDIQVLLLELNKKVLGDEHPITLKNLNNLAGNYGDQGRLQEAEDIQVRVIESYKRTLGAEHPRTLTIMANLASIWKSQDRDTEAIKLMEECVQLQSQVLDIGHPERIFCSTTLTEWKAKKLDINTPDVRE